MAIGKPRVKSYADVLVDYEFHPESKCADATGEPCEKQTIGLLQRRHIQIAQIKYIGKESNNLEEVDAGLVHSQQNVYTEYPDRRRDEWQTQILRAPTPRGSSRRILLVSYYGGRTWNALPPIPCLH